MKNAPQPVESTKPKRDKPLPPPGVDEAPKRTRKRLTRDERAPSARKEIFDAAAKVVGEHGYANASIQKITAEAGIAQGTFYLYFKSQQDLFDELLPRLGIDMLSFVSDGVKGAKDIYDLEERGVRSFFAYCELKPWFYRVLNEAEIAAPVAYQKHFKIVTQLYVNALQRAVRERQIKNFKRSELETVAYMLMAARIFLHLRAKNAGLERPEEAAIKAYMKLVRGGLT